MKDNSNGRSCEAGGIFFYILLGVVLFATLSYVMTRSMRGTSVDLMSERQAELLASDLITYAQDVAYAVDRVRRKGCSENDISFERAPFDGSDAAYVNTSSPGDFSCHVYHPDGGSAPYQSPPEKVFKNGVSEWFFGVNRVGNWPSTENWGTAENDLTIILSGLSLQVCDAVNDLVKERTVWESSGAHNSSNVFQGNYSGTGIIEVRGLTVLPPNAGCFCDGPNAVCEDSYSRFFYLILLER